MYYVNSRCFASVPALLKKLYQITNNFVILTIKLQTNKFVILKFWFYKSKNIKEH